MMLTLKRRYVLNSKVGSERKDKGTVPRSITADEIAMGHDPSAEMDCKSRAVVQAVSGAQASIRRMKRNVEKAIEASYVLMQQVWDDLEGKQDKFAHVRRIILDPKKEYTDAIWGVLFMNEDFMDTYYLLSLETLDVWVDLLWLAQQNRVSRAEIRWFVREYGAGVKRRIISDIVAADRK